MPKAKAFVHVTFSPLKFFMKVPLHWNSCLTSGIIAVPVRVG